MKRIEVRRFAGAEIRDEGGGRLEGYAAIFNQKSLLLGSFREVIKPGAFARALREGQDVRALVNHDPSRIIGRTKSGTLKLSEDRKGLRFSVDLPDTECGEALLESVRRGDIDQCSFSFTAQKQAWLEEKNAEGKMEQVRELHDVDLFDVSAVTYPAYPQTSLSARSLFPDGMPEEVRTYLTGDRELEVLRMRVRMAEIFS